MDQFPIYCRKEILIAGVGNKLFGDDGFGPEVIEYLAEHYDIPEHVCLADAGTGIRKILFTLSLSEVRPRVIVIIDAVDKGRKPGELFDIPLDEIPTEKTDDFSIHQVPSSNLLKELQDLCSVKVRVKVCQIQTIPETIQPGLSEPVKKAVPLMAQRIAEECFTTCSS
jgi:coenzyme F420 hydrogenase subunit delta